MRLSLEEKRVLLGLNITYYRRARNLTQSQLAERANISSNYLSQIERGFKNISFVDKINAFIRKIYGCFYVGSDFY